MWTGSLESLVVFGAAPLSAIQKDCRAAATIKQFTDRIQHCLSSFRSSPCVVHRSLSLRELPLEDCSPDWQGCEEGNNACKLEAVVSNFSWSTSAAS
mmetsp:Transcript_38939/g.98840  ORF Transcript_38939/g.98840 Transcript_38939/m.98840 type:complete len:97 (-) Transcript_38939:157-447(-)